MPRRLTPKDYPDNWEALAHACKVRAKWQCEHCGAVHGSQLIGKNGRIYRVDLMAAHLDHDPWNPSPRLAALCQGCHLRYDLREHASQIHRTSQRKRLERQWESGQLPLFAIRQEVAI